ncbi:hypothetical protein LC612_35240 [Nostoc sp. CHAB 5834]|nr:hypothetical protein [Nostoc sp. CHAB 5834]
MSHQVGVEAKVFCGSCWFYWQRSTASFVYRNLGGKELQSLDFIPVNTMLGSEWNSYVRAVLRENPGIIFDDIDAVGATLQGNLVTYSLVCERVSTDEPSEILEYIQRTQVAPASRADAESVFKAAFIPVNSEFNEALASLELKVREYDGRLQDVYDDDEVVRYALSVLIPEFEYPDYSHKYLSEILAKIKRSVQ